MKALSILGAASLGLAMPVVASAQTQVHARMHTSSGSCASCDLSQKSMTRMQMVDADFSDSNFFRSNLSGGRLDDSNLTGAVFSKAYLVNVRGERVDFSDAVLRDATLTEAVLTTSKFGNADMRRADLSRGVFTESDFAAADLSSSIARGADFTGANFRGARLRMANMDGANLTATDLRGVIADEVSLDEATITDANLSGADLRKAKALTQAQLDTACGDANTILPISFSIDYCDPSVVESFDRAAQQHDHQQAIARLDSAITDLESVMVVPNIDARRRRQLQRIHAQLVGSRRALGE